MEAHPRAALFHVPLESCALDRILWPGIQEQRNLILGQDLVIEISPISCRTIKEIRFLGFGGKPSIGLSDKADVRLVLCASVKGNDFELFSASSSK
jgi:hypothetical protein